MSSRPARRAYAAHEDTRADRSRAAERADDEAGTLDNGLHLTEPEPERAILVGAPLRGVPVPIAHEHLDELARLADTAGALVQTTMIQRVESPHPRFYIGEGKVAELKELARARDARLVIFDEELSPSQGRNLEQRLEIRIMDRAELILDIFATRARTAEAQMQVELAQLEYMLPRLKRMWTHLSRIRGGIGFRGPGETQLETDRRLIGRRIRDLRRKLTLVAQQRAVRRKGRVGEFRAALVGYTNAGKSSVLRALSGADVFIEDRLFATLDPATRVVELAPGARALVTDTVGFIRRLPHHLVASFRATLEEAVDADVVLHVIDASHTSWEEQKEVVEEVLRDLGVGHRPTVMVFNKIDRLTHAEEEAARARVAARFPGRAAWISAVEADGTAELLSLLRDELRARRPAFRVDLPVEDGEALAMVYREGEVLERQENGALISVVARLSVAALGRLQRRAGVDVSSV
ncbi:MAG: GTPase HflX [Gemmatimonadetes bacterium]|nr:GTPase HflX [Gemmatimonadota bacterium]